MREHKTNKTMIDRVNKYVTHDYVPAPPDRLSPAAIREANARGLKDRAGFDCYRTPVLQLAYNLGQLGIDLTDAPIVAGIRYGKAPDNGISYNYRDNKPERGLSLAQEQGRDPIASSMWFDDRKAYEYRGIKVGYGSDGETIILPLFVDNLD